MKIQLSPDVLVDFLRGVPREKITELVNRGADSQFTDIAQAWLHRFDRNVQLHYLKLEIDHSRAADGTLSKQPTIYTSYEETNPDGQLTDFTLGLPIPQVQLPDNITGFEYIDISYLDNTQLEFLRKLGRLFTDVNLYFSFSAPQTIMRALLHLFPLFEGIHSINMDDGIKNCYNLFNHYPASMRKARVLNFLDPERAPTAAELEHIHFWLCNRRDDEEPRMASMDFVDMESGEFVLNEIRERFLASKWSSRASFFVRITYFGAAVPEETLNNWTTREQLHVQQIQDEENDEEEEEEEEEMRWILISRCPIELVGEWLEQKRQWATEWAQPSENNISVQPGLCDVQQDAGQEQEEQQPGTSNQHPTTTSSSGNGRGGGPKAVAATDGEQQQLDNNDGNHNDG